MSPEPALKHHSSKVFINNRLTKLSQPFIGQKCQQAMKKQLVLIFPLLAAMIGMLAIVGMNSANAQNMSTSPTNMTSGTNMTNSTMGGNMTSSDNMTTSTGSSGSMYNK